MLLGLFTALAWSTEAPAAATTVIDVDPRPGSLLYEPLDTIRLTFDSPVNPRADSFSVSTARGEPIEFTSTVVTGELGTEVTLSFEPALGSGRYRLEWTIDTTTGGATGVVPFDIVVDGVAPAHTADAPSGLPSASPLTDETPPPAGPLVAIRSSLSGDLGWSLISAGASLIEVLSAMMVVGLVLALTFGVRARPDEIVHLVTLLRVVVGIGAICAVASTVLTPGGLASWASGDRPARALLAMVCVELVGLVMAASIDPRRGLVHASSVVLAPVGARLNDRADSSAREREGHGSRTPSVEVWRWDPTASPVAVVGVALVAVTIGARWLTFADTPTSVGLPVSITLVAGMAWLGSCVCTVTILLRRSDAGLALDPTGLLVPGRRLLGGTILLASVAGAVALARLGDLASSVWQSIAVTTGPVALAAALVNRSLVPYTTASGRSGPAALARFSTAIELIALLATAVALVLAIS